MLLIAKRLEELNFSALMDIYIEGNREKAEEYGAGGLLRAEREFYDYLREDFFHQSDAFYAVWVECGLYVSALRLEPHKDGWLLEALETAPDYRKRGYAKALMETVLHRMGQTIVYYHVSRRNLPSLRTHYACGFQKHLDHVVYLDGSVTNRAVTLRYIKK
jgi:GNAT superfamily N-acetyltransferase